MTSPLHMKTVFDALRPDNAARHEKILKLHVASWHKFVRSASGLTVTSIGPPSGDLSSFITDLGGRIDVEAGTHPLYARSPIYNKHLSAPPAGSAERIYLTDNDTVYLSDIHTLIAMPEDTVGVSLSDLRRVSPDLWDALRRDIDLDVLEFEWVPYKEKAMARAEGREPVRETYGYFNGGAILFPAGRDFWDAWEAQTYRLSRYFESRGMDDRKDAGSDQLSLTCAVARHGRWRFLPEEYNVRPFHLRLDTPFPDGIAQLHLVNTGRAVRHLNKADRDSLTCILEKYWDVYFGDDIDSVHGAAVEAALATALSLVEEYDID